MPVFFGLALSPGAPSFATIIATTSPQSPQNTFSVSATDLVNSDQATFTSLVASSPTVFAGQAVTFANNGAKDYSGASNDSTGSFGSTNNGTYTFTLNTTLFPHGYELNQIDILSGFDGRRISHNYTIDVSFVGDASFVELIRVPLVGTNTDSGTTGTRFEIQTAVTEDSTGILATGVDQIRFTFRNDSNETVYREIDVFGAGVVVPEPSTLGLAIVGLLGLGLVGQRRRKRLMISD